MAGQRRSMDTIVLLGGYASGLLYSLAQRVPVHPDEGKTTKDRLEHFARQRI